MPEQLNANQLIAGLAAALAPHLAADVKVQATGTPVGPYVHGEGGLFGAHGLSRDVISTRVLPQGLASMLPVRFGNSTDPLYPYFTGFTADTGDEAEGPCDDCIQAGSAKTCYQTATYGRKCTKSRELQLDRIGEILRRSEFTDLRFVNDPLARQFGALFAGTIPQNLVISAGAEVLWRLVEVGQSMQNWLTQTFYTGNPANNSAAGGYQEFPGVDILYGTGKFDALLGDECDGLDSIIFDFAYENADEIDAPAPGVNIVRLIVELYRQVQYNSSKMNLNPSTWAFSMRQSLFWALADLWPCVYNTDRCAVVGDDATVFVDGAAQREMSDAMRTGRYLLIDGVRVPVVVDDSIVEENSGDTGSITPGCFASDIYLHNLTTNGGRQTLYWDMFDFRTGAMVAVQQGRMSSRFWSDGGALLWTYAEQNWCAVHEALFRPRLRVETPFLSGRISDVQYCPIRHEREPFPGDPYEQDGGVSGERDAESLYSDWNPPA
jgi:hypothetical protein